jgi:hypothetical protein
MAERHIKPEFPPILKPGPLHILTVSEVRREFVLHKRFKMSATRRDIMRKLVEVIDTLNNGGIVGELWIDGGFVTEKINPEDVDTLLHVSSDLYASCATKRALINWASHENLLETHSCDAYRWIEYSEGHAQFAKSEQDRIYWSGWYGNSMRGVPKGIAAISLPAVLE